MTDRPLFDTILEETRRIVGQQSRLRAFMRNALADLPFAPQPPAALPVLSQLGQCATLCSPGTRSLTHAILAAAPQLHWDQSYTEAQVGAHYLANYGWFNLVSPEGAFVSTQCRVSVGFWAQGLTYPPHRHQPEEIYCVLAGSARFETEGRAPIEALPQTLIHHPSNVRHGMHMENAPLLAMAFWTGRDLLALSTLETPE